MSGQLIQLRAIGQEAFDRAGVDTAADVPCILLDGRHKLTLAEASELHGRLGALISDCFEQAKASLRNRHMIATDTDTDSAAGA